MDADLLPAWNAFWAHRGASAAKPELLLAVSGGVDSTVMVDLAFRSGIPFGVGHCNFNLRGKESEEDAQFVNNLATAYGARYFQADFDTVAIAEADGRSIQETARKLRYEWLEKIRLKEGFDQIATAHHLNDSIETALINFTRGAGLRGLVGVPGRYREVVRPLLRTTRTEILKYAEWAGLTYREDSSNTEDKYTRNKIRNRVIPVLKSINPNLEMTAARNFRYLEETAGIFDWAIRELALRYVRKTAEKTTVDLSISRDFPAFARTLTFEWTREYGFNGDQAAQAVETAGHSGAVFYSRTHRMLVDRQVLWIEPLPENDQAIYYYLQEKADSLEAPGIRFEISRMDSPPPVWPAAPSVAYFDAGKLDFPLVVRHWQPGDHFQPLGMAGKSQKLQDFFSNLKLSRFEKERTWILCSGSGEIAWVVGRRMDERFKVNADTGQVLAIRSL